MYHRIRQQLHVCDLKYFYCSYTQKNKNITTYRHFRYFSFDVFSYQQLPLIKTHP